VKAERQFLIASKIITKTSIIVIAIFLPISLYYLFFSSFSIISIACVTISLIFVIGICVVYFYLPSYKFKKTAKYQEEYMLTFSTTGILFNTPNINSEIKWDFYSEFWESTDFYYLIQDLKSRQFSLIPKRVFTSSSEMKCFEELSVHNIKQVKRI